MYSRNVNKRYDRRRSFDTPSDAENTVKEGEKNTPDTAKEETRSNTPRSLPELPPNYRGMIGELDSICNSNPEPDMAEGIDRLVSSDDSYNKRERCRKNAASGGESRAFAHLDAPFGRESVDTAGGLRQLVEGLRKNSFGVEDILICSMIVLMLNGSSDDDILIAFALLLLL